MTRTAAALLLALAAAGCASPPAPPPFEEWAGPVEEGEYGSPRRRSWEDIDRVHVILVPYAWRASGRGESLVRDFPVRFDEGDDSDLAWGGRAEMYSERVGFFLDGFFTNVSHEDAGVEYDDRYGVFDLGAAMRVLGGEPWQGWGERPAVDFELDGLAIFRNHFLKMDATPAGSFTPVTDDAWWADLVLGMRGAVVLAGRLSLFGRIDGGGMALNQWRSWTWSAEAGAKLRITPHLGAVAAWRWYASHWEDGVVDVVATPFGTDALDNEREIRLEGPWVGIVLEF